MPKLGSRPEKELSALRDVKLSLKQIKTINEIIAKLQEGNIDLKLMIGRQKFSISAKTNGNILKSLLDEKKEIAAQIRSLCKKYRIELTEEDKSIMSEVKVQIYQEEATNFENEQTENAESTFENQGY